MFLFIWSYKPYKPHSTKTRIKTPPRGHCSRIHSRLTNHTPQKQGLRQRLSYSFDSPVHLTNHTPQKQGLRPTVRVFTAVSDCAYKPHSTKTRIKTWIVPFLMAILILLTNHTPQKQGLRLLAIVGRRSPCSLTYKPHSTKTRIKTCAQLISRRMRLALQTTLHKNKD